MTFVTRMADAAALSAAILFGCGLLAPPAQAGYVVTLEQVGSNVVATGSGPLDLTGLIFLSTGSVMSRINPSAGNIVIGPTTGPAGDIYFGVQGPTSFGSGGVTVPSSGSGDIAGEVAGTIAVPEGYVSDNLLSSSATWDNASFSSLAVTPGTYGWTWGTGPNQNFTLDIIAAAVPEPSAVSELAVGLAGLALAGLWRRRRRT